MILSLLAILIAKMLYNESRQIKGTIMSFVIYGTDNSKRVIVAKSIHEAYSIFIGNINNYFIKNYNYKIERLYQ